MPFDKRTITGIILAGGRARRLGGVDKGLIAVCGRPMIEHVIEALQEQVEALIVNANRSLSTYRSMGCPVVTDADDSYSGPLAGMSGGLHAAATPLCITVPCDSPLIGSDVPRRLCDALEKAGAEIAVAHDGERAHPVVNIMNTALASSIDEFLAAGERKIDRWFDRHRFVYADFSDHPEYFINVNTEEDRLAVEGRLCPDRMPGAGGPTSKPAG